MKITIEINKSDSGVELFYHTLADMIGRHVAEVSSQGNMGIEFVACIYRKIADEIDAGRLTKESLSGEEGAKAIKEGFLEGLDHDGNAEARGGDTQSEWPGRNWASSTTKARSFWDDVERIPEVLRVRQTGLMLPHNMSGILIEDLARMYAGKLGVIAKIMRKGMPKVSALAAEFGVTIVDDAEKFLYENNGFFELSRKPGVNSEGEGQPVVQWADIFDFPLDFDFDFERMLKMIVTGRGRKAYQIVSSAVSQLPESIQIRVRSEVPGNLDVFDQIDAFEVWVEAELENGLPRIVVDRKIKADFPLIAPYAHHFISSIEFMFPGREVLRKEVGGRLTFRWRNS